jgi:type I restriction enzyme S subunit
MVNYTAQTSISHFTREQFLKFLVALPPFSEQQKIAEILSTWDTAIKQTRKVIEAKKRRKKALMQQLLTGKKRLPGFNEKWKEYPMGELFKERRETNYSHLPLLAITGSQGIIPASEINRKDSSNEDKSKYKRIVPDDIGYNTMRMWQGVSAVSTLEGIVSPAYTICIPKHIVDVGFMGYFFKFSTVINIFWRYSQGLVSDTLNLKYNNFSQIKVLIPAIEEQRRIAQVLSAADNEINQLEKKLNALEKQKRGLMQKLLTGEVRVK